ncbi:MAG TPA: hypothetical protein VFD58_33340 [Blastocatellia bacterium]|nr:hypothetical protein [Blastocatellia bacterium]
MNATLITVLLTLQQLAGIEEVFILEKLLLRRPQADPGFGPRKVVALKKAVDRSLPQGV